MALKFTLDIPEHEEQLWRHAIATDPVLAQKVGVFAIARANQSFPLGITHSAVPLMLDEEHKRLSGHSNPDWSVGYRPRFEHHDLLSDEPSTVPLGRVACLFMVENGVRLRDVGKAAGIRFTDDDFAALKSIEISQAGAA